MHCCKIEVLSHVFVVTNVSPRIIGNISNFSREFIKYKRERVGKIIKVIPDKVYVWRSPDASEYRFHVNMLPRFLNMLSNVTQNPPEVIRRPMYTPAPADVSLDGWIPREEQVPILEYCITEGHSKLIGLQTGKGKTSCSLKIAELLGTRVMVALLGRYYSKWIGDLTKQYRLKKGELMSVRGTQKLMDLLAFAHDDPKGFSKVKVILTTIGTLLNYAEAYYELKPSQRPVWMCSPDRVCEMLQVGTRITDELHQHFYTNFMLELFSHVPKALYLSATMESDDELTNKMALIAFPLEMRINGGAYDKVSDCIAVHFRCANIDKIPYTGFGGSYNHTKFEESILKRKGTTTNYFLMLEELIKVYHLPRVNPKAKHKLLIFAATVEMCLNIRDFLSDRFPQLTFYKYTSVDDEAGIFDNDVTVTTIGSAGTALDIPGLLTCINTIAINSRQANEQALGRLRDLRQPGVTPLFLYFVCDSIQKHLEYHDRKEQDIYANKVFTLKNIYMETI